MVGMCVHVNVLGRQKQVQTEKDPKKLANQIDGNRVPAIHQRVRTHSKTRDSMRKGGDRGTKSQPTAYANG